jgi:hypothetical protein
LLAPAALLVGYGWKYISQLVIAKVRLRMVFGTIIILIMILTVIKDLDTVFRKDAYKVVIGTVTREEYLYRNLGPYYSASQKVRELPKSSKVLMLWEPRGLYMPENVVADIWIDHWYTTANSFSSKNEIISYWNQNDFSHLIINDHGKEFEKAHNYRLNTADWELLDQTLDLLPAPVTIGQDYLLYTLD